MSALETPTEPAGGTHYSDEDGECDEEEPEWTEEQEVLWRRCLTLVFIARDLLYDEEYYYPELDRKFGELEQLACDGNIEGFDRLVGRIREDVVYFTEKNDFQPPILIMREDFPSLKTMAERRARHGVAELLDKNDQRYRKLKDLCRLIDDIGRPHHGPKLVDDRSAIWQHKANERLIQFVEVYEAATLDAHRLTALLDEYIRSVQVHARLLAIQNLISEVELPDRIQYFSDDEQMEPPSEWAEWHGRHYQDRNTYDTEWASKEREWIGLYGVEHMHRYCWSPRHVSHTKGPGSTRMIEEWTQLLHEAEAAFLSGEFYQAEHRENTIRYYMFDGIDNLVHLMFIVRRMQERRFGQPFHSHLDHGIYWEFRVERTLLDRDGLVSADDGKLSEALDRMQEALWERDVVGFTDACSTARFLLDHPKKPRSPERACPRLVLPIHIADDMSLTWRPDEVEKTNEPPFFRVWPEYGDTSSIRSDISRYKI